MSKFQPLYNSLDRLNAAIKRAEEYLENHPAWDTVYWFPDNKEDSNSRSGLTYTDEFGDGSKGSIVVYSEDVENGKIEASAFPLSDCSISGRIEYAKFIPDLIKQADDAVNIQAIEVDELVLAIDAAIPNEQEIANKPKRKKR